MMIGLSLLFRWPEPSKDGTSSMVWNRQATPFAASDSDSWEQASQGAEAHLSPSKPNRESRVPVRARSGHSP